ELVDEKIRQEERHQQQAKRDGACAEGAQYPLRARLAHTRMTAVVPNRPCGRASRMIAIRAKGTPTFSSLPMKPTKVAQRLSATPTISPPTIAPAGESHPP